MRAFIDRIEDDIAVLLLGEDEAVRIDIPVSMLPDGLKEGMCLSVDFSIDQKATDEAHDEVQSLLDSMKNEP